VKPYSSILITCISILFTTNIFSESAVTIAPEQIEKIAQKIWHNECGGTISGLTTWNHGETCASLGIGHFIWYPTKKSDRFHETFPELLTFLQGQGAKLPAWLAKNKTCPWQTRTEFYNNIQSKKMQELRTFLVATIHDQALFIAKRLTTLLPSLIKDCTTEEQAHITHVFNQLAATPQGLYALIDYLNFKGAGISSKENYHKRGWGLKQVLLATNSASKNLLAAFSDAAKRTLAQRVHLAPKERHENRWLSGWLKRIDSYTKV
jgi:hypothetical protein